MNWWLWLMNRVFGIQYVILKVGVFDIEYKIRRAYRVGVTWFANPYLPETRTLLLPNGQVSGRAYVTGWEPITKRMVELYEDK